MKINYNGHIPRKIDVSNIATSQAFEYDNYYYMKIEIACANMKAGWDRKLCPVVNLHSGTVRMLEKSTPVWPLQSKVSLRQLSHTHEELNGCDDRKEFEQDPVG